MNRKIVIDRIPQSFCEGPFWGNGTMGAVMYLDQGRLCVSIDHVELWELRETLPDEPRAQFDVILEHQEEYRQGDPRYVADTDIFGYAIGRTKLPALAVELSLNGQMTGFEAQTDLAEALTGLTIGLDGKDKLLANIWLDSCRNLFYLEFEGEEAEHISLHALGWDLESERLAPLKRWGYEPCRQTTDQESFVMIQHFSGDKTAVLAGKRQEGKKRCSFAVTIGIGSVSEETELIEKAVSEAGEGLKEREAQFAAHCADWARFWSGFAVSVPNERLQESFDQEMYKLYCNERPDSSPVTLQGVWNPNNRMPAWYGDLHNDLNVQSCYWPAYKTGNTALVQPYIDYYAAAMPRLMLRAKKLFGIDDAIHVPTMMAPDGTGAASEWCYWNTILGPELFVAADFCWYYNYSLDDERLKTKIVPFIDGVLRLYEGIAYEGGDGYLHIPFTTSPEVSVMKEDSTFTLSTLHYLMKNRRRYAQILGERTDVWERFDERLAKVIPTGMGLPLFPGVDVYESHRHFCQLFPIYPLGEEAHNELANRSLDTAINQGFLEFAAFSFPYLAIMAVRCGRGNMARTMLEIYCMAFRSRNSFTVNGDPYQNGVLRISDTNAGESSDAFTLESGFFIPAALCEMFVHRCGNTIWLLPGMPDEWKSCRCRGLAVEGGHKLELQREEYHIRRARLSAGSEEVLILRWEEDRAARSVSLNGKEIDVPTGDCLEIKLEKDDCLEIIW